MVSLPGLWPTNSGIRRFRSPRRDGRTPESRFLSSVPIIIVLWTLARGSHILSKVVGDPSIQILGHWKEAATFRLRERRGRLKWRPLATAELLYAMPTMSIFVLITEGVYTYMHALDPSFQNVMNLLSPFFPESVVALRLFATLRCVFSHYECWIAVRGISSWPLRMCTGLWH
jgi:hypothetical protein